MSAGCKWAALAIAAFAAACGGDAPSGDVPDQGGAILRVSLTDTTAVESCSARVLGTVWRAECDERGTVRFSGVWTGDRDIEITAQGAGLDGLAPTLVTVAINPGLISELDVNMYRSGAAHGNILVTEPRPVDALIASDSSFALSATSGVYFLQGLVPGRRSISAYLDDGVIRIDDIPVTEADVSSPVDFSFANWSNDDGVVEGLVEAPGFADVRVRAFDTRDAQPVFSEDIAGAGSARTFSFTANPGAYWVEVTGALPLGTTIVPLRVSRLVFVAAGDTSQITLSLPVADLLDKSRIGDFDGDGIADADDLDPFDPRPEVSQDGNENGVPDIYDFGARANTQDTDSDGWADEFDNCPFDVNPTQDPMACTRSLHDLGLGVEHTCVRKNADVYCWGSNQYGQLGVGAETPSGPTPRKVSALGVVSELSVGALHSCALTTTPEVYCWGRNIDGQVSGPIAASVDLPRKVPGLPLDIVAVGTGLYHSCALSEGGRVLCWGRNLGGVFGNGTSGGSSTTPVEASVSGALTLSVGGSNVCVEVEGGTACWGANGSGQVGNGAELPGSAETSPVLTTNPLPSFGYYHACGVEDGTAYCWGSDEHGQLGDGGGTLDRSTPQAVAHLPPSQAVHIAALGRHTCAVDVDGGLFCWGQNFNGQLGGQPSGEGAVLVDFGQEETTLPVKGTANHTCVIADGNIVCWGNNFSGQCGTETEEPNLLVPTMVSGI